MRFGIFEHMDNCGVPLSRQIAERMQLVEAYDRLGFYAYHLAEHHGTPLGLAPSPSLMMAAIAQRTKRLRFGPLVYLLPLYHPLRLIEEICFLDQMSGGRLELGVGRGVSPIEVGFYGVDAADGPRQFPEALRLIKQGLTADVLTFKGEFYQLDRVPMVLKPVQQPHPPLWYGLNTPDATQWAAKEGANIATLVPAPAARRVIDRFREEWSKYGHPAEVPDSLALGSASGMTGGGPLAGIIRHMVLAETESEARAIAERAYRRWYRHLAYLWTQRGMKVPMAVPMPEEIGPLITAGGAFAGTPEAARAYIAEQVATSGANYFVCDITFGDITLAEATRSVELLGREVLPHFAAGLTQPQA
jgi:alkanesulfonate monooxygenase SsuD/methylene tetrahydromethanopterin reductase-like flavin-dependent oxidoreductase (luciferase family)